MTHYSAHASFTWTGPNGGHEIEYLISGSVEPGSNGSFDEAPYGPSGEVHEIHTEDGIKLSPDQEDKFTDDDWSKMNAALVESDEPEPDWDSQKGGYDDID